MNGTSTPRPVVLVYSILAGLQVINGGLALIDTIDKDIAAIISLVIGAVTAAAAFWVEAQVTPWSTVVTKIQDGHLVSGPAVPPTPDGPTPPVNP